MRYNTPREPMMEIPVYRTEQGAWQFGQEVIEGWMVVDDTNPQKRWICTDTAVPIEP